MAVGGVDLGTGTFAAHLRFPTQVTTLARLPGSRGLPCGASGVNVHQVTVGSCQVIAAGSRATLWPDTQMVIDLTATVGIPLERAHAISDDGHIVGTTQGRGWLLTPAREPLSPPSLALRLNHTQFSGAGHTLVATLRAEHQGPDLLADFYFGIVLPDGMTIVCVVGDRFVVTRMDANPSTLRPWVPNAPIEQGLNLTYDFWHYTFQGSEPPGAYAAFLMLTTPGAFQDGRIDEGDILTIDWQAFQFVPQVASR
jgi:hypothetical protein